MRLIIEGHSYDESSIKDFLNLKVAENGNTLFSKDEKLKFKTDYVGYCYSKEIDDCIFFLPKVIINNDDEKVFGFSPEELIDFGTKEQKDIQNFLSQFPLNIYCALKKFYRKNVGTTVVHRTDIPSIGILGRKHCNTFLDILLSLIRFNNENRSYFTFVLKKAHSGYNKINWHKTISSRIPVLRDDTPIYLKVISKKRVVNYDEELLILFFSILHYINKIYGFHSVVDYNYDIIDGNLFEEYLKNLGCVRLRQIKYKYFSDKQIYLWNLCYAFFDRCENIRTNGLQSDYLLANNFNIVFEDMVDDLIGDQNLPKGLKEQKDGKIVDHIYKDASLLSLVNKQENVEHIYYIGDSKYYKKGDSIEGESIYKQFTYAKNVIQYNINEENKSKSPRYRDDLTEGYNVTPNFFIRGYIDDFRKQDENLIVEKSENNRQYHYENRLFDRDTLWLTTFSINFLFVLSAYISGVNDDKKRIKEEIKTNLVKSLKYHYDFYKLSFKKDMSTFVEKNFKCLNGKIFRTSDDADFIWLALEKTEKYKECNDKLLKLIKAEDIQYEPQTE